MCKVDRVKLYQDSDFGLMNAASHHLTQQDFDCSFKFLKELNLLKTLSEFPAHLMSLMPLVIGSDFDTLDSFDQEVAPMLDLSAACKVLAATDYAALAKVQPSLEYLSQNPVVYNIVKTGNCSAAKISDYLTQAELHRRDAVYEKFLRPIAMADQMMLVIAAPTLVSCSRAVTKGTISYELPLSYDRSWFEQTERLPNLVLALYRDRRSFTERDRAMLNLLQPHILQAYENSLAVSRVQQESLQIRQAVDQAGMIVLHPDGRVRLMSDRASKLFNLYFQHPVCWANSLPDAVQHWLQLQLANLCADYPDAALSHSLQLAQPGKVLTIRLLADPEAIQYLLMLEEKISLELSASLLESLGLSQREAEVLLWMMRDHSNAEIAGLLTLSHRTVQKHTENIYRKLAVTNRAAAVLKVVQQVGDLY